MKPEYSQLFKTDSFKEDVRGKFKPVLDSLKILRLKEKKLETEAKMPPKSSRPLSKLEPKLKNSQGFGKIIGSSCRTGPN